MALLEYENEELENENVVTFDNGATYYWSYEIEQFIYINL